VVFETHVPKVGNLLVTALRLCKCALRNNAFLFTIFILLIAPFAQIFATLCVYIGLWTS
jgi:hypothetical protein